MVSHITRVACSAPKLVALDRLGEPLSPASGSFLRRCGRIFLVTNWHVMSGYNPQTGETLSGSTRDTWSLRVHGRVTEDGIHSTPITWDVLVRDTVSGEPLWTEHPTFGRKVDVAAIELTDSSYSDYHCTNDDILWSDYILSPGETLYILGYPKGISGGRHLPIWKSGTIATEPYGDLDELPRFLIDATTTDGMSGSPVLFRSSSFMVPAPHRADGQHEFSIGKTNQVFWGIYSGRVAKLAQDLKSDPAAAQLGYVWRASAVMEILDHACTTIPDTRKSQ